MEERKGIKHHLIDVVNPDENFNAALFAEKARAIILNWQGRGRRFLLWEERDFTSDATQRILIRPGL